MTYYEVQRHCTGTNLWMRGDIFARHLDKSAAEEAASSSREYLLSAYDDARVAEYELNVIGELLPVTVAAPSHYRDIAAALASGMSEQGYVCVDVERHATAELTMTFALTTGTSEPWTSMTE